MHRFRRIVGLLLILCACNRNGGFVAPTDAGGSLPEGNGVWWKPTPGTSWQWQLSGTLDISVNASVYDIDLFNTTLEQMASLHGRGRNVICYFDTTYEPSRPDSALLEPYRGNPIAGWPGQYWLDIRQATVVDAMKARIALARQKNCDAVEADEVDSRSNDPGFPITATDQQNFIRLLAAVAHGSGLSFALKNDLAEIPQLINDVDFAINEQCFSFYECDALTAFIARGKAVFQVEYTDGQLAARGVAVCPRANAMNFDTLIKHPNLDAPRYSCR